MTKPTDILAQLKRSEASTAEAVSSRVRVGMATCGISAGADAVFDAFVQEVKDQGLGNVEVLPTGCVGRCDLEPMAEVIKDNEPPVQYVKLDPEKVARIVREHLIGGSPVEEYS